MTDYAPAIPMYVPSDNVFMNQIIPKWVVIHKTAGGRTAQDIANYFAHDPKMASTHYVERIASVI